jgi:hypothetical protein
MKNAITPGGMVQVELTAVPRSEAARKTLVRLFRRDADVQRHHRAQQAKRPSWQTWRRGNATWHHQMKTRTVVALDKGASYRFLATVDVLRDLASVARWVKVTPAK